MLVALLVVAGFVLLTAVCLGALMSLATHVRHLDARRAAAAEEAPREHRYAGA